MSEVDLSDIFFSEIDIAKAAKQIAAKIQEDYSDPATLVLVAAMDGAVCFLADLMREIKKQASEMQLRVTTARLETNPPKGITIYWLPSRDSIEGQDALIVDGIIATGKTCKRLKEELVALGAKSVRICALLETENGCKCDVQADYFGFKIQKPYVVGYGLDYKGAYRELPYIRSLGQQDIS